MVLLLPFDADTGRESGAEERPGFVEVVVGVFAVVEAGFEIGSDEDLLGTQTPPPRS